MEIASKVLEQIVYNTRPKIEEHILIIMNNSTHEDIYLNHYKQIINNLK